MKAKSSGVRPASSKVSSAPIQKSKKEDAAEDNPAASSIFTREQVARLTLSGVVEGLREDAAPVERVVDYLADGGHVGVNVHAVAGAQVADDALGRDFEGRPR